MRTNVHHLVRDAALRRPEAPALTAGDVTVSYAALWEELTGFAAALQDLGVQRGERVAVFLDKRLETVVSLFAISGAGAVFVPVNPVLKGPQVAHILGDCDVTTLVTTPARLTALEDQLASLPALKHVVVVPETARSHDRPAAAAGADLAPTSHGKQLHDWWSLTSAGSPREVAGVVDTDIAAILYTSGSTGKPKGVVLSHRNLLVGAESVSSYLENTADDVILAALPLSFDAGLSQVTTAFHVGAHVVLMNYLLPRDVVRLCARHRVTGLTCVPPLWAQIADVAWPAEAAAGLRYFANTGGRMPKALLGTLRGHFPQARPYLMYGLTEAFRSTYLPPEEVDRRPDSIGRAIPNAEILVVRPDGTRCAPNEEGELVHRGALVALGYWGAPEKTAERFRPVPADRIEGLLPEIAVWSGDTVRADEDGFLYFVGRKDDMIKTSGYRVSPSEVEEVAYDSGLVRDAVAIGRPHERLGEEVVLVVAPAQEHDGDTDELRASLLAVMRQRLPLFMVPAEVEVRDQVPRSPNGKFDRPRIRDEVTRAH